MKINGYDISSVLCETTLAARKDGKYFIINIISNKKLIRKCLAFFVHAKSNSRFQDFVGYFTEDNKLFLVFAYPIGENIKSVVTDMRFDLKHMLVRQILAALMIQDIPAPILCDVLTPENIVMGNNKISFVYQLSVFDKYDRECMLKVMAQLSFVFRFIYGTHMTAALDEFLKKVGTGRFGGFAEIYAEFNSFYDSLSIMPPNPPQSFPLIKYGKAAMTIILAVVSAVLFCYSIYITLDPPDEPTGKITSIGTVTINEQAATD